MNVFTPMLLREYEYVLWSVATIAEISFILSFFGLSAATARASSIGPCLYSSLLSGPDTSLSRGAVRGKQDLAPVFPGK